MPTKKRKVSSNVGRSEEIDDGGSDNSSERKGKSPEGSLLTWRRVCGRIVLCVGVMMIIYITHKKDSEQVFAKQSETVQGRKQEIACSKDYKNELTKFKGCVPQRCGRLVTDWLVSPQEAAQLLSIAKKGLVHGGSSGGASIFDLHSGALSYGDNFVNVYKLIKKEGKKALFTQHDFQIYRKVKDKIHHMIATEFGILPQKLYLTHPTFFSQMSNKLPKTKHDEYWHIHVDKETYGSFHYTSLLYLSDYDVDFTGGRLIYVDKSVNLTLEPKMGRVVAFTSGSENPHYVERVTSGIRYALTVSFTCNKKYSIDDLSTNNLDQQHS
ncbi:2-oxoglutarate and iron-dependent oxygenase domain-containing protein 3-like isoform X1 [Tachypleus tridentatus]|uniref:2-oxoglutarate and iron-dependent oxygenase domain-containing protein 3-like isoform X1 n=1 Tax=Tachypleus tridentatus TaxID=6853 RepID=UPI003FD3A213